MAVGGWFNRKYELYFILNRSVSEYTLLFINVKKIVYENSIQKILFHSFFEKITGGILEPDNEKGAEVSKGMLFGL